MLNRNDAYFLHKKQNLLAQILIWNAIKIFSVVCHNHYIFSYNKVGNENNTWFPQDLMTPRIKEPKLRYIIEGKTNKIRTFL